MTTGGEDPNTMQSDSKANESFRHLQQIVERLQQLAGQLTGVMDQQTEAIIAGDEENMETLTEDYSELRGQFEEQELKFVNQLHHMLGTDAESTRKIRLELLKETFPDAAGTIDQWRQLLRRQARELKQKNKRIVDLLDFALSRNAELMYAIYSLNNRKNTHYGSGGQKEEISSGMAVNKEA